MQVAYLITLAFDQRFGGRNFRSDRHFFLSLLGRLLLLLKEVVHGRQIEPGTGDAVLRVARVSLGWMHSSFEGAGGLEQRKTVYECGGECVRSTSRIVKNLFRISSFLLFFTFFEYSRRRCK